MAKIRYLILHGWVVVVPGMKAHLFGGKREMSVVWQPSG